MITEGPFNGYRLKRMRFKGPPSETIAGASLKPDAVVHRVNGLEEVRRTRNSRWRRYSHLVGNQCSIEYEI